MNPIPWIRIGLVVAIAAALIAGIAAGTIAVRSHLIAVGDAAGDARVQSKWNAQKAVDAQLARQLAEQARAEDNRKRLNAERIADEQDRKDKARAARIADADRTVAGLRGAIAKLDVDDLSAAAADPRVAAVAARAVAARELLGSCSARYTSLAATADRVRDQAAGLLDYALNVCPAAAEVKP